MKLVGVAEMAAKWNVSERRVTALLKEGRIPGAEKMGHQWMIPVNAAKPGDTRKSDIDSQPVFRFPIYIQYIDDDNEDILTADERRLYRAERAMMRGDFKESDSMLADIIETTRNRYVLFGALFFRTYTAIYLNSFRTYTSCMKKLESIMQEDFPHKNDLGLMMKELEIYKEGRTFAANRFTMDFTRSYDVNTRPYMSILSSCILAAKSISPGFIIENMMGIYEVGCWSYEEISHRNVVSLQMHLFLACAYYVKRCDVDGDRHIRRAIELAESTDSFFFPGSFYMYLKPHFDAILPDYDRQTADKIVSIGKVCYNGYNGLFSDENENLYNKFSIDDYRLVAMVLDKATNKEIAYELGISEKTVERRLDKIYEKSGTSSKKELVEFFGN